MVPQRPITCLRRPNDVARRRPIGPALGVSLALHAAAALALLVLLRHSAAPGRAAPPPVASTAQLIFLNAPGPGGGGGGGGNRMPDPPRHAERPGRDAMTVPVAQPSTRSSKRAPEPDPLPALV